VATLTIFYLNVDEICYTDNTEKINFFLCYCIFWKSVFTAVFLLLNKTLFG